VTGPAIDPASPAPQSPPTSQLSRQQRGVRGALVRYRFMAFFTGVMLLILTFVAIPLQVWGHNDVLVHIFGFIHGWGFIVYLLTVADLGLRLRWHLVRIVLVGLAGTVPFCSFIAEHQIMKRIRAEQDVRAGQADSLSA
jgi:integral membrane protein